MTLPKYPEYKPTGIAWVGAMPAGWRVARIRHLADLNPSKTEVDSVARDTEVSFVPMEAVGERGELALDCVRELGDVESGYTYFRDGDVTFAKITPCFENGKGAVMQGLCNGIGFGTTELIVARPRPAEVTPRYLHWLFSSSEFRRLGEAAMYGAGGQKRVSNDFVRGLSVAIPPIDEQRATAAFLDSETVKIDALVAEQETLIALLKEKRRAAIHRAVTKGLDPSVPMKGSGNQWLGEVPAHWRVLRLKHVKANVRNSFVDGPFGSNLKSEHFVDDGEVYVIESGFATRGQLDLDELKTISMAHFLTIDRSEVREGDIVIAKIGAYFGKSSILPHIDKPAVVSGNSLKLTVDCGAFRTQFVHWFLANLKDLGVIDDIVNATAQPALSLSEMNNLPFLAPNVSEQDEIVEYLETRLRGLDDLVGTAERTILLLQERRAALISAVVTGKIDVRGAVALEPA